MTALNAYRDKKLWPWPILATITARFPTNIDTPRTLPGMYLKLFHGFVNDAHREALQDWGAEGPVIGPLQWFHITYCQHFRGQLAAEFDPEPWRRFSEFDFSERLLTIPLVEDSDCWLFDGIEFGDLSVFQHPLP